MSKSKYYWLKVTKDKYELPIAVADTAKELASMLGVATSTVQRSIFRKNHKYGNSAYIVVPREEGGD